MNAGGGAKKWPKVSFDDPQIEDARSVWVSRLLKHSQDGNPCGSSEWRRFDDAGWTPTGEIYGSAEEAVFRLTAEGFDLKGRAFEADDLLIFFPRRSTI